MKFIRDRIERWFVSGLTRIFGGVLSEEEIFRFARYGSVGTGFVMSVATFIVMLLFFGKWMLVDFGFEYTVVFLLIVIVFMLRIYLETR